MSSYLRLECKQKFRHWNAFWTRIFLHFRSYSSGIETTNTFIRFRSSLENHTRFQTKQKQKGKNAKLCGGTNPYGLQREVPHPPPPPPPPVQLCYKNNNNNGPIWLFCRLLQQIARMEMVWNLKKLGQLFQVTQYHAFKCQQQKNTLVFSFVRYRLPNSTEAFQIYTGKDTKACFKRRATAVLSWLDCSSTVARLQHDTSTTWFQKSNLIQSNRTTGSPHNLFV